MSGTGLLPTTVYLVGMKDGDSTLPFTKVGIATHSKTRLSTINSGNPFDCFIFSEYKFALRETAVQREREAIAFLSDRHKRGEWFHGAPSEVDELILPLMVDVPKPTKQKVTPPPGWAAMRMERIKERSRGPKFKFDPSVAAAYGRAAASAHELATKFAAEQKRP